MFAGCSSVSVTNKTKIGMDFIAKIHPDPLVQISFVLCCQLQLFSTKRTHSKAEGPKICPFWQVLFFHVQKKILFEEKQKWKIIVLISISTIQLFELPMSIFELPFELPVHKEKRLSGEGHELELQVVDPYALNIARDLQFLVVWRSVIPLQRLLFSMFEKQLLGRPRSRYVQ